MNPSSSSSQISQFKTLAEKEMSQLSSSPNYMKPSKQLRSAKPTSNSKRVVDYSIVGSLFTAKQQLFNKSLYLITIIATLTIFSKIGDAAETPANHLLAKNEPQIIPPMSMQERQYSPEEFSSMCSRFPSLSACVAQHEMEKRKSAYMRFGRSSPSQDFSDDVYENLEKRKSAYMRFGKRFAPYEEYEFADNAFMPEVAKRKSAYMRFGKRKSAYMRFGKRSFNDLENEEELQSPMDMEKRKSAYMRFGKRSLLAENENNVEKRKSAYMRFGRR